MDENSLFPRLKDLAARCQNRDIPAGTFFLTPKEQAEGLDFCRANLGLIPHFYGGYEGAERKVAFFLPDYIDPETFDLSPYVKAVHAKAPFSSLSHRDFLGSIMALGIERECVGDIIIKEQDCWFFLTSAIAPHIIDNLIKVGRGGVSLEEIPLEAVPVFEPEMEEQTFTVASLRADAVVAGAFRVSRSSCQELFARGDISVNYFPCMDKDMSISEGDMISLRHHGKAKVLSADGRSRKGRIFVTVGIYK